MSSHGDPEGLLEAAHEWALLLEDPAATRQDRERFEMWRAESPAHADLFDRAVTFREAFVRLEPGDFEASVRSSLRRRSRIDPPARFPRSAFRWPQLIIPLAAVFVVVVLAAPLLLAPTQPEAQPSVAVETTATAVAETRILTLQDGTRVTLGPATELRVRYSHSERVLAFDEGAAYFEVAEDQDRPLSVTAGKLTATALGTAFEIRTGGGVARVAVAEGEVQVSYSETAVPEPVPASTRTRLQPGQMIAAGKGGLRAVESVALDEIGAWRENRLIYSGATVAEVIDDVNRYSQRPVVVAPGSEAVLGFQIRGVFLGTNVDALLESLSAIHPIEVDRSDTEQIVLRQGDD
ncbi:MAG: FecR domain-containing protein [Pseudomonadota bacterium]